jgi:hypothetical protein
VRCDTSTERSAFTAHRHHRHMRRQRYRTAEGCTSGDRISLQPRAIRSRPRCVMKATAGTTSAARLDAHEQCHSVHTHRRCRQQSTTHSRGTVDNDTTYRQRPETSALARQTTTSHRLPLHYQHACTPCAASARRAAVSPRAARVVRGGMTPSSPSRAAVTAASDRSSDGGPAPSDTLVGMLRDVIAH